MILRLSRSGWRSLNDTATACWTSSERARWFYDWIQANVSLTQITALVESKENLPVAGLPERHHSCGYRASPACDGHRLVGNH